LYVVLELGAALYLHALVLLSDGFPNLSDVVALYIAYWSRQAKKREISDDMSYGWARTEILGALTNGCFLLSLCLYIALESIPRFIHTEEPPPGMAFVYVAGIGLIINVLGVLIFACTGQTHAHSHSHSHSHSHEHNNKHGDDLEGHHHEKPQIKRTVQDLNTYAVFIHFLGDALSSVVIVGVGLVINYFRHNDWVNYLDPGVSLLIVVFIIWTTIPLVKRCAMILLQSTPNDIKPEKINAKILQIQGITNVHDLHVWQLVDGMIIASVHVEVEQGSDFTEIVNHIRKTFHKHGIHSSSIQPEFVSKQELKTGGKDYCEQNCISECDEDWCCKKRASKLPSVPATNYRSLNL